MEKTLLIANPASQNGNGAAMAEKAASILRSELGDEHLSVAFTAEPKHASHLAASSEGFSTVITLGGDGAVHEVANGLMWRSASSRPALGVIPAGSGNDYAKSLGIPSNLEEACRKVLQYSPKPVDIGKVDGEYFVETLSFGLDAAIALDTMERRKKTGRKGALLYMESGINQLLNHLDSYEYTAKFGNSAPVESSSITFAIQIGPYYGGGFKICPDAKVDSGVFDICIGHPPIGASHAIAIFLRAKSGKHVSSKQIEILTADCVDVDFKTAPPAQIDGELIEGKSFNVTMEPRALQVLRP